MVRLMVKYEGESVAVIQPCRRISVSLTHYTFLFLGVELMVRMMVKYEGERCDTAMSRLLAPRASNARDTVACGVEAFTEERQSFQPLGIYTPTLPMWGLSPEGQESRFYNGENSAIYGAESCHAGELNVVLLSASFYCLSVFLLWHLSPGTPTNN
jgi:hypothetical protein